MVERTLTIQTNLGAAALWINYEQATARSIALNQGPLVANVRCTVQTYITFSHTVPTSPSVTALHCPPGFKSFLSK